MGTLPVYFFFFKKKKNNWPIQLAVGLRGASVFNIDGQTYPIYLNVGGGCFLSSEAHDSL
jgi:hypothetical protein